MPGSQDLDENVRFLSDSPVRCQIGLTNRFCDRCYRYEKVDFSVQLTVRT